MLGGTTSVPVLSIFKFMEEEVYCLLKNRLTNPYEPWLTHWSNPAPPVSTSHWQPIRLMCLKNPSKSLRKPCTLLLWVNTSRDHFCIPRKEEHILPPACYGRKWKLFETYSNMHRVRSK